MKTKAYLVFLLLVPCFSVISLAQEKREVDSVLKIWGEMPKDSARAEYMYDLQNYFLFNNIDLSKRFAEKFLVAAKDYGTKNQVGHAYYALGMVHRTLGNKDSSKIFNAKAKEIYINGNHIEGIINTDKALAILYDEEGRDDEAIQLLLQNIEKEKKINSKRFMAGDYKHLAGIYHDKKNYELALQYCIKSLDLYEAIDYPVGLADAYFLVGQIEDSLGDEDKAIASYSKALDIYIEEDDKFYQAYTYNSLGKSYAFKKNYKKSNELLLKGHSLAKEMQSPVLEGSILHNLGGNEVEEGNLAEGIKYLRSSLKMAEDMERIDDVTSVLNSLAEAELKKNSTKVALDYINRSIAINDSIDDQWSFSYALKIRSKIYESKGRASIALEDYKRYETISDSLFNIEKSRQIEELRTIYDTEKKEQQIAQQETEINLLEEKEKVSNLQKILLGGGLGLSAIVLGLGFYGFRQRLKRNQLAKEKIDAELQLTESELAFKKKELTSHALHLAKKNEVLEHIKQKAKELKASENNSQGYQQLIHTINFDQQDDKNWENFTQYFEQVHKDFSKTVKDKYPEVTKNELRLMALLKMNLSSKEIATILNISSDGVKKARQRLRKKMKLSPEKSLESTVLSI